MGCGAYGLGVLGLDRLHGGPTWRMAGEHGVIACSCMVHQGGGAVGPGADPRMPSLLWQL
jgi:hypothetical protein